MRGPTQPRYAVPQDGEGRRNAAGPCDSPAKSLWRDIAEAFTEGAGKFGKVLAYWLSHMRAAPTDNHSGSLSCFPAQPGSQQRFRHGILLRRREMQHTASSVSCPRQPCSVRHEMTERKNTSMTNRSSAPTRTNSGDRPVVYSVGWEDMLELFSFLRDNNIDPDEFVLKRRPKYARRESNYSGVKWRNGSWAPRIQLPGSDWHYEMRTFAEEKEAAAAYDVVTISLHGEGTKTNLPIERYSEIVPDNVRRLIRIGFRHHYGEVSNAATAIVKWAVQRVLDGTTPPTPSPA